MKKHQGWFDLTSMLLVLCVAFLILCVAFLIFAVASTAQKQENDRNKFMADCLQDKKQYECDVLWAQTDESKQNRDLSIGIAAGAAIGAAAGRR